MKVPRREGDDNVFFFKGRRIPPCGHNRVLDGTMLRPSAASSRQGRLRGVARIPLERAPDCARCSRRTAFAAPFNEQSMLSHMQVNSMRKILGVLLAVG